jgi:hypothetical protein
MQAKTENTLLYRLAAAAVLIICLGYLLYIGSFILAPLAASFLISLLFNSFLIFFILFLLIS